MSKVTWKRLTALLQAAADGEVSLREERPSQDEYAFIKTLERYFDSRAYERERDHSQD
jgi:hypothetical protein